MAKRTTKKKAKEKVLEDMLFSCRDSLRGRASLTDKREQHGGNTLGISVYGQESDSTTYRLAKFSWIHYRLLTQDPNTDTCKWKKRRLWRKYPQTKIRKAIF